MKSWKLFQVGGLSAHRSATLMHNTYKLIIVYQSRNYRNAPVSPESWSSVLLGKKWAYTGGASYAIYKLIPEVKLEFGLSPVMLMKGRKNEVEVQGMIDANIRDAVALIDLASILDREIGSVEWDELRGEIFMLLEINAQLDKMNISFGELSMLGV